MIPGRAVLSVAADLLREARSRKWFLGLGLALTAVLVTVGLSLKLEVVDGALAATRLFGHLVHSGSKTQVNEVTQVIFAVASYLTFYAGTVFGILSCSDFAPNLLSPGRIEHLLSLPVRRWELLLGTFLGVLALALLAALYGAGGLVLILGVKTGIWTAKPLLAALLAGASFASLYAWMLTTALFIRSAALSTGVGAGLFVAGIIASYRAELAKMFEAGPTRETFKAVTLLLPRIAAVADVAGDLAGSQPVDGRVVGSLLLGLGMFALGALAIGVWRFEQRDF